MKTVVLYIFLLCFTTSCISKKITKSTERISLIKNKNDEENTRVERIADVSNKKLQENKTDSSIDLLFTTKINKIQREKDSIQRVITELEGLLRDKKTVKENYSGIILPKIKQLEQYNKKAGNRMKVYLMLEDGLNAANFTLFDLAAFFGPGKYIIPENKSELAIKSFDPMLDSVIYFSNKYSGISRTATLVILGFADGQGFNAQNNFNEKVKDLLPEKNPTSEALNKKLSELRAQELINVLSLRFLKRSSEIQDFELFKIEYLGKGKGEQFPLAKIKDYKTIDERRRIVLCYWAVLPD